MLATNGRTAKYSFCAESFCLHWWNLLRSCLSDGVFFFILTSLPKASPYIGQIKLKVYFFCSPIHPPMWTLIPEWMTDEYLPPLAFTSSTLRVKHSLAHKQGLSNWTIFLQAFASLLIPKTFFLVSWKGGGGVETPSFSEQVHYLQERGNCGRLGIRHPSPS